MFKYIESNETKLNEIWDLNIQRHQGDDRWKRWKQQFLEDNKEGKCKTFLVLCDDLPIGEGTLLFSQECRAIRQRDFLANHKTVANINALRILKAYEGQGHISKLVKLMEDYAKEQGYQILTIGVEKDELRNQAIYKHWGYNELIYTEIESGVLVEYYQKNL